MSNVLPQLLGGIGLFLYAIYRLSEVMKTIFSDKAKSVIEKYTSNTLWAILMGILITILLGSSSAVIILIIVFINSKVLKLRQAMGLILGANIGTTFSSQLLALDVGMYSIIPFLLGLAVMLFTNNSKVKRVATAIMYMGMLFFGMFIMEQSVSPLRDSPLFKQWMADIENNSIKGALVGGFITLLIQSSSGTVGMAIILAKQNLLHLTSGLAIMLGAELGTCSDTLMATIKGSRQAIKAGIFHVSYNLFTIILALVLFVPFVHLVETISNHQDIGSQIANGHVLFNVLGVLLGLPFLNLYEKALHKLLPDTLES